MTLFLIHHQTCIGGYFRLDPIRYPKVGVMLTMQDNQVTIESVARDGSAMWCGLQPRDRVLAIGGEAITDLRLCEELLRLCEGKIMDILVERPKDVSCLF